MNNNAITFLDGAFLKQRRQGGGGAQVLLDEAHRRAAAGDLALACHLADFALEANPSEPAVQEAVATIYEQRAEHETSLMAINLFLSAAAYARAGRPYR